MAAAGCGAPVPPSSATAWWSAHHRPGIMPRRTAGGVVAIDLFIRDVERGRAWIALPERQPPPSCTRFQRYPPNASARPTTPTSDLHHIQAEGSAEVRVRWEPGVALSSPTHLPMVAHGARVVSLRRLACGALRRGLRWPRYHRRWSLNGLAARGDVAARPAPRDARPAAEFHRRRGEPPSE